MQPSRARKEGVIFVLCVIFSAEDENLEFEPDIEKLTVCQLLYMSFCSNYSLLFLLVSS